MDDIKRIYLLLSQNNGLKIRVISDLLELDKHYVSEVLFSLENSVYWFQDDDSLWYAKEGSLQVEETDEKTDEILTSVELPQRFNINKFLDKRTSGSLFAYFNQVSKYRLFSNDEMQELFRLYRNGDKKAFDLIIKSQQRLVSNLALLYSGKGAPLEDIIQEGNIGLIKAAERFDFTQYRSFANYAKTWILQSISTSMTYIPYIIRLPLNQLSLYRKVIKFKQKYEQVNGYLPAIYDIEVGEDIDFEKTEFVDELPDNLRDMTCFSYDLDCFESTMPPIDNFQEKEDAAYKVEWLMRRRLKKKEILILKAYYGLDGKSETDMYEIADYWGLTRERVRQIVESAKHKLNKYKSSETEKSTPCDKTAVNVDDTLINNLTKYSLSTSLLELKEQKIITRKQLKQCHKKKLWTIGDVKRIIEKYNLTPESTRFTSYTLDMWFYIVGLLK